MIAPGQAAAAGAAAAPPVLELRGVRKSFGAKLVLDGVDLAVHRGEIVVVLGANGSGKSTLLRSIVRLVEVDGGEAVLDGDDLLRCSGSELRAARRRAAMVFQQMLLVRRRTALENVAYGALAELPLHRSFALWAFPTDVRERAAAALLRVGLAGVAHQRSDTLSGGQAQRVAVARALCQRASVLLADEPVASLDPSAADGVLALLADVAHVDRLGVLVVLHQPDLARRYADRLVGLARGHVVFDRAPARVADAEIAALYRDEDAA